MIRWQRGEAEIVRLLAGGELQLLAGGAADGAQWLTKARRTLSTAAGAADADPDSAFTLSYDAARFACTSGARSRCCDQLGLVGPAGVD